MDVSNRLRRQERTVLRIIEQAGDSAGLLMMDRITGLGVVDVNRVHDLVVAGCCEFCGHPSERTRSSQPASAVRITQDGRWP